MFFPKINVFSIFIFHKGEKVKEKTSGKTTTKKSKSKDKLLSKKEKVKLGREEVLADDLGIVVIEDSNDKDKESELEERRAFLEEARSQEASDD